MINKDTKALLVRDTANQVHIITQQDILTAITS
jgi:predicted transcriptional regulator